MNLSLPKLSCNNFYLTIDLQLMVPKAPIGIKMFETIKSMLSKMVPAPIFTSLKLLNERVAGMLITNTNTLPMNATRLRLRLSF